MMRWKSAAWVMHLWLRTHVGDWVAPIGIASGTADRADLEGVGRSRRQVVNGHGPRIGEQPGVFARAGRAASADRRIQVIEDGWTRKSSVAGRALKDGSGGCDNLWTV